MRCFLSVLWCTLLTAFLTTDVSGQAFNYELTGNPVDITGWDIGPQSSVNGDHIELTQPVGTQAGYIYYATPSMLTECSQFTVTFEFSITNSSFPTADGIAFWYIQNPPSGFTGGGGIGLPNNPNGLLLILDTYNNNGFPDDNPLVSLRRLDGTSNYDEGTTTGQVVPDQTYQTFIADGNWHTCTLTYYYGDINVSFDGNAPLMTGNVDLSGLSGYFGFSAGTGALYSLQSIRNVSIIGAPVPPPPAVTDLTYCLNETAAPLTAAGNNLHWYTVPTGGTELSSAPVPSTSATGTFTWYVSQEIAGCNIESERAAINVTVSTPPPPVVNYQPAYCMNDPASAFTVTGSNPLWYDAATGGIGNPVPPVVNTGSPGVYTWYVSQTIDGCESVERTPVTVTVNPLPTIIIPEDHITICLTDSLDLPVDVIPDSLTYTFTWSPADGLQAADIGYNRFFMPEAGSYNYLITATASSGCSDTQSLTIEVMSQLQLTDVSPDTTINYGDRMQLRASGALYYQWTPPRWMTFPSDAAPWVAPLETTTYTVVGINEFGCRDTADVKVTVKYQPGEMLPSAFSPNGDGLNDRFRIENLGEEKILQFSIFNRWGEEVYDDTGDNSGWDGTYKGIDASMDVYNYIIRLSSPQGYVRIMKGTVTLVR